MSGETAGGEIESLRAEIASLKAMVAALGAVEDGGFDFVMMGSDDAEQPIVPIGGGGQSNFEPKFHENGEIEIGEGYVCVGRRHYTLSAKTMQGGGEFRLKVELGSNGADIQIEKGDGFQMPKDNVSYIPLYTLSEKGISKDYRYNFCVPARE